MTTYTITNRDDVTSGLTAVEAADILLTDDGYQYEIRREDDGKSWRLFISQHSLNSTLGGRPLVGATIWSFETDETAATADIAKQVVDSGRWEKGEVSCYTDERYAEMQAELAVDES